MWRAFRNKRGSLFTGRRVEQAFGNFTANYFASKGVKDVNARDFMPNESIHDVGAISVDEMFKQEGA